jgi:hypothetical protein
MDIDLFSSARYIVSRRRDAFCSITHDHKLHPAVKAAIASDYPPANWHQLLLEWPHISTEDPNMLAYSRDERAMEAYLTTKNDRQTKTKVGKYLHRHFPTAPDSVIRAWSGLGVCSMQISDKLEDFVLAVQCGPESCMQWSSMDDDYHLNLCGDHPYEVYEPQYGWRMATRTVGDRIDGRCLLNIDPRDGDKVYVRSYARSDSMSGSDHTLEAYVEAQGFRKVNEWPEGLKFAKLTIGRYGQLLFPYLDPGSATIRRESSRYVTVCHSWLERDDNGEYCADNTDGTLTEVEDGRVTCDDCGCLCDADDTTYIEHNDQNVCSDCINEHWCYAAGRRGHKDWYPEGDCVCVGGEWYADAYLSDNDIVLLHDGDYAKLDDAVWIESTGEYYHINSEAIVSCYDIGEYRLRSDCVEIGESWYPEDDCALIGNVWHLQDDCTMIDGVWHLTEALEDQQIEIALETP